MLETASPVTESRNTFLRVEVRSASDRRVGGYAAVFNRHSQNLGGFVEVVNPTFFNKSKAEGWEGAVCRYNHEDLYLLGTTKGGTLRLNVDETGLEYNVDVPECRGDVFEMIGRGDINQSSFAFQVTDQDWAQSEQGFPQRTLLSGKLLDVAPVTVPAYQDTTVGLRSLAEFKKVPFEDVQTLAANDELRKLFVRTDTNGKPAKPKPMNPRLALMQTLAEKVPPPV